MNPVHFLLAFFVFVALGATGGYRYASAQGEARVASLQAQHAEDLARATSAAAERLDEANRLGEVLAAKAAAAEVARNQVAKERDDAIKKIAVGRPCLGAGLVGVLNAGTATAAAGGAVPDAADGAEDDGAATDTDLALWIGGAIDAYEACRSRLDVVATWREQQQRERAAEADAGER